MVSEKIKDEVKKMNHKFVPVTFQPKGKDVMTAYEVRELEMAKKLQLIVKNMFFKLNQNDAIRNKRTTTAAVNFT